MFLLIAAMYRAASDGDPKQWGFLADDLKSSLFVTVTINKKAQRVMRLSANRQDRECFTGLIETGAFPDARHDSHKMMANAYNYFAEQLEQLDSNNDIRLTKISELWNALRNQLWYIHIICEDEINAQVVFESLNAKGEDLSTADLIKNYVFMELDRGGKDVDEADKQWSQMISDLGRDSFLPDYVHTYWNSKYSYSRVHEIYTELKRRVSNKENNVWHFLQELRGEAQTYAEVRDPSDGFWKSPATARMLRELRMLNVRITQGIIMALWVRQRDAPKQFEQNVRRLLHFIVRYSKVCQQPSNSIDEDFSRWARDLRDGNKSPSDFAEWLIRTSPDATTFIDNFKTIKIKSGPTARLILMKINNEMNSDDDPDCMVTNPEKVTLEHVIPQAPNDIWQQYLADRALVLDDLVHRVGNLTLLTQPKNSYASNREFLHKRDAVYRGSDYPITKDLILGLQTDSDGLVDPSLPREILAEFGLEELARRQERLATIAEKIFRVD